MKQKENINLLLKVGLQALYHRYIRLLLRQLQALIVSSLTFPYSQQVLGKFTSHGCRGRDCEVATVLPHDSFTL